MKLVSTAHSNSLRFYDTTALVADLRGPTGAGWQHLDEPYRIYRRQYAHEPLLVA
eukprot:CAMPEP_0201730004 /NCGR_PEP_ID=MMETSP0593-20130828/20774_1 /ASSEMBLY_ACC=CAM_ASM_000672 /TAXON_ID=267983 /ORGANISM="Skeletonema japonicum, Strain CCMP2506" /LENGTH=54 /DNA_ID=CAMNT_0048222453 /DNA_START=1 /DNA_END=161 /DNA_ORIENTATION=-